MKKTTKPINSLILKWYDQNGRKDLPWRKNISAYRVWISEIMLQQTQVSTVIPYFEKFIKQFPTIKKLADAELDEVLHLWAGLGYYSRARNLHKTAQIVVNTYKGKFPDSLEQLQALPGIGRSTAGAILSIAYNKPAAILDGNVKRVLTRLHAVKGWPGETNINKKLWQLSEGYTPNKRVDDYTQAIMDIGATICTRNATKCDICPIKTGCVAHSEKNPKAYPYKKPSKKIPTKAIQMLLITNQTEELFLIKRPPIGIWGGLWSLPECALDQNVKLFCQQSLGFKVDVLEEWPTVMHSFSHYHLAIYPIRLRIKAKQTILMENREIIWYKHNHSRDLGFAAPVKKLVNRCCTSLLQVL